jgi:hypothetical protein
VKLLTVTEAAAMKGVTKQAIHAAIKAGRLPIVTIQLPVVRIDSEDLRRFQVNRNMQNTGRPARANGHKGGRPRRGEK